MLFVLSLHCSHIISLYFLLIMVVVVVMLHCIVGLGQKLILEEKKQS